MRLVFVDGEYFVKQADDHIDHFEPKFQCKYQIEAVNSDLGASKMKVKQILLSS